MAVIGIDLGTTYSAAARFVNGQTEIIQLDGYPILPSVVSVLPNGKVAVGNKAKRNQEKNPQDTIIEVKRKMGKSVKVPLGQKEFTPQEISAMILTEIKRLAEEQLGEEITGAVISCPAYFKDPDRQATKEAGELAGLKVLQIVNEPTAAAYAYGLGQNAGNEERLAMVYDLGGGTFDVTVIKMTGGNLEVIGTGGDPQLGGGNFDDEIVKWMLEEIQKQYPDYYSTLAGERLEALKLRLKAHAETAKKKLCGPPELLEHQVQIASLDQMDGKPIPFRAVLTKAKFEDMIQEMMIRSMKWLDVAMQVPKEKYHYTEEDITDVLLVGGSTRVPLVRRMLEERFGKKRVKGSEVGIDPDEIVARGASMVAAQADPYSEEVVNTQLVDVTGHTLSVAVYDESRQKETLHPLILKETPIPHSASHHFASMGQLQRQCLVKVYQGEGEEIDGEGVTKIGEFFIEIPPVQEQLPLEIGLRLDKNSLLIAHARELTGGKEVRCEINYKDSAQLSPEVLKQKQAQLAASLEQGVGRSANPLEQAAAPAQPGWWANPGRPTQPNEPAPQPAGQGQQAGTDMNTFAMNLVSKALTNFARFKIQDQMAMTQAVGEVQAAIQSGDQMKIMLSVGKLSNLLAQNGIA